MKNTPHKTACTNGLPDDVGNRQKTPTIELKH